MEIQDAKQARPHCELIAELLDSRQPKTERETAQIREGMGETGLQLEGRV